MLIHFNEFVQIVKIYIYIYIIINLKYMKVGVGPWAQIGSYGGPTVDGSKSI